MGFVCIFSEPTVGHWYGMSGTECNIFAEGEKLYFNDNDYEDGPWLLSRVNEHDEGDGPRTIRVGFPSDLVPTLMYTWEYGQWCAEGEKVTIWIKHQPFQYGETR